MGTISKNFSYSEFEKSETADRLKILNIITSANVRDAIKALTLKVLQPLRGEVGPLKINSGYRCEQLNSHPSIGGVKSSQHVKGEAADIASSNPYELAKKAVELELPFDQIILYPTFVHFSHKLDGEQRGKILYNKKYKGERL